MFANTKSVSIVSRTRGHNTFELVGDQCAYFRLAGLLASLFFSPESARDAPSQTEILGG